MERITHILPMQLETLDLYKGILGNITKDIYGINISERGEITIGIKCNFNTCLELLIKLEKVPFNIQIEGPIYNNKISNISIKFRALSLIDFYYKTAGANIINLHFYSKLNLYVIELEDTYPEKYFTMNGDVLLYIFNNLIKFNSMLKVYTDIELEYFESDTIDKYVVKRPVNLYHIRCRISRNININNVVKTLSMILNINIDTPILHYPYDSADIVLQFTLNQYILKNIANYIATI